MQGQRKAFIFFLIGFIVSWSCSILPVNSRIVVTACFVVSLLCYILFFYTYLWHMKEEKQRLSSILFIVMTAIAGYTASKLFFITAMYWG